MSWAVVFENHTLPMLLAKLTPMGGFEEGVSYLADEICVPLVRSNTFVNEEQ